MGEVGSRGGPSRGPAILVHRLRERLAGPREADPAAVPVRAAAQARGERRLSLADLEQQRERLRQPLEGDVLAMRFELTRPHDLALLVDVDDDLAAVGILEPQLAQPEP